MEKHKISKELMQMEKKTIPLVIRYNPHGEFRLEPLAKIKDFTSFEVTFKFYGRIIITDKLVSEYESKKLRQLVKQECLRLYLSTINR